MRNWWIRFGCFLTGYNYNIVRQSNEVAAKAVKRYTSAVLIVCIIWSFIGYTFTQRYLHGNLVASIAGAVILVTIIIQIERQIILSINPGKWLYLSRGVIAVMMAIIGTIIIDQIIFKEDIELEKVTFIQNRVDSALRRKTAEIRAQITDLDSSLATKERERERLLIDLRKNPTIPSTTTTVVPQTKTQTFIDSNTNKPTSIQVTIPRTIVIQSNVENPNKARVDLLNEDINQLHNQRSEKQNGIHTAREILEKEIREKVGFLDELEVMFKLITHLKVALAVWLIWFLFLFGLELLVLISKINEKENDYDKTIVHQMTLQNKRLDALARIGE